MGYEIIFYYKESEGPGTYSEEVKTKSHKVGKTTEDIPLEVLASKVMSQLVRRNILIVEVEIYEYAKKRLNYKERADGILIKNKKFSFDSGSVVSTEEFEEDEQFKPVPSPSKELADRSCPIVQSKNLARRPIRHEIYDPDPMGEQKVKQKGLRLTLGKRYSIYSEESMGSTLVYSVTDDSGKEVKVNAEYFVAVGAGLSQEDDGPRYVGAENQKHEVNLWGNNQERVEMPEIRRR